ncbi:MAG TPA: chemotaxis protein CheA [Dehalococcoidia bacterium]|nr:chemotaxis protein CheA [Dehalococcoidia bacterium]
MPPGFDVHPDDLKAFLQEVDEQLDLLDDDIVRLEREADNVELLQEIFRAAHTLKGSSGMLGFQRMAALTHAMEDVLDRVRKGTLPVTPELVDALLQSLDGLKALKARAAVGEDGGIDIDPLVTALRAVEAAHPPSGDGGATGAPPVAPPAEAAALLEAARALGRAAYRVVVAFDAGSAWLAVRNFQVLSALAERGDVVWSAPPRDAIEREEASATLAAIVAASCDADALCAAVETIDEVVSVSVEPLPESGLAPAADERLSDEPPPDDRDRRIIDLGPEARGKSPQEQLELAAQKIETLQTIRIDVERLDSLMNMVGELAIDRTRISQICRLLQARHKEDELVDALADTSAHIVKVVDELHESMMQIRMLPIGLLFGKFPRLVRDLARTTGKAVTFLVEGQDTEIDRSVIDKIKDPLVHLIRNAVDHGIESPEERRRAGKPETGTIRLSARHDQGYIVVTLEDDGRGIDVERVKEAAVQRGLISADVAHRLSESEALDLIFQPGLSTARATTEVSGRGVGMDVVRRDIEALNGLIDIESVRGRGTRFSLRLPLTLATFRGLLVESAGTAYAIPLSYVQETVRPAPGSVATVMGRQMLKLRGSVLPLLPLREICRIGGREKPATAEPFVVIVRAGERTVALAVDALIEQQEIVVKSLGGLVGHTPGVAGASILGDGQVVLILDVPALIKAAVQRETYALAA